MRVEADINPFQFLLGSPRGIVEIAEGKVAVPGREPQPSRLRFSRCRAIELLAGDCQPVSVRLRVFIRVRSSSLRWRHLTFRPHEEPVASCLAALRREGFTLDRRARAIVERSDDG